MFHSVGGMEIDVSDVFNRYKQMNSFKEAITLHRTLVVEDTLILDAYEQAQRV